MHEAGKCAYTMPTPGSAWQVVGAPVMHIPLLVSPLVPSTASGMEGSRSEKEAGGGTWDRQRTELSCGVGTGGRAHRLCTQPGSGLEWRPPALAGLESLLGVAGGRCMLLARQVLVAGSTHRGSG